MEPEPVTGRGETGWILAFDAGCGRCRRVIDAVTRATGDRFTTAGLGEDRIRALRTQALGEHPPFVPTLLAVEADRVRAWTGPRMSMRLALLLGPRHTLAVVRALNRMDVMVHGDRRRFLKAAPGVALGLFLLSGGAAAPALAATGRRETWAEAREWAARLPARPAGYDEFTTHSVVRRRALFAELAPPEKAELWKEHIQRFRTAHPDLSAEQADVLRDVEARLPAVFGASDASAARAESQQLQDDAIAALGSDPAYAALAMLGPEDPASAAARSGADTAAADCWCNVGSAYSCPSGHDCGQLTLCTITDGGCGFLWQFNCDGNVCYDRG